MRTSRWIVWLGLALLGGTVPGVRAAGSLTLRVTHIPAGWGRSDGDRVGFCGSLNGWGIASTVATVTAQRLEYYFPDTSALAALGSGWEDRPAGANLGFRFVDPVTGETRLKADFRSNDGNFRLAVSAGQDAVVEIDAGPAPLLIDQATAARVNGVRAREVVAIDRARYAFPGGRWKALVMSYDDGHVQDRGLAPILDRYGIKGTFHLTSGWFDSDTFVTSAEIPSLFARHELSVHTVTHPDLTFVDDSEGAWQVGHARWVIEQLAGYGVRSMSYPMGGYNERVMNLLSGQGITCSRTVEDTFTLDYLPPDYRKWHPTCHHVNAEPFAQDFIARTNEQMTLLCIWGHSYELDYGWSNNSWDYMTRLCALLGDRDDVWYAGMEETRAYLDAVRGLDFPAADSVRNPSSVTVWIKRDTGFQRVGPGKTSTFPAGRARARPDVPRAGGVLALTYDPLSNALARAGQVWVHVGHDGWQEVHEVALTPAAEGRWMGSLATDPDARQINFAFHDGQGTWDDNVGADWSLALRSSTTGLSAQVHAVPGAPVVSADPATGQNAPGETVDLATEGGAARGIDAGGFGRLGQVYVNVSDDGLFLGGFECDAGSGHSAIALFLHVDTMGAGVGQLWGLGGPPDGLDRLHNVLFDPPVHLAILLGDEFGDGSFKHFNLTDGPDLGQGVFSLVDPGGRFVALSGARLAQFDGVQPDATQTSDDDGNRRSDRWEAFIPWSSLCAPLGAASVGRLAMSALVISDATSGSDRYISANYLGAALDGARDGYGNHAFNLVTLRGVPVGLPGDDADLDGMPDAWEQFHQLHPQDGADASSDNDLDGLTCLEEFLAGTDPTNAASAFWLHCSQSVAGTFQFGCPSVTGRSYALQSRSALSGTSGWQDVSGPLPATGDWLNFAPQGANSGESRYFRLRLLPP